MANSKRKERSRGKSKTKYREIWVNSCGLSSNQVTNAVGSILDSRTTEDLKFYLVRTLYSDPNSVLFQEGMRLAQK